MSVAPRYDRGMPNRIPFDDARSDLEARASRVLSAALEVARRAQPILALNHPDWRTPIGPVTEPANLARAAEAIEAARDLWCPPSLRDSADQAIAFLRRALHGQGGVAEGESGLIFLDWMRAHLTDMRSPTEPRVGRIMFLVVEGREGACEPFVEGNGIVYLLANPVPFEGARRAPHFQQSRLQAIEGAATLGELLRRLESAGVKTVATGWEFRPGQGPNGIEVLSVGAPLPDFVRIFEAWRLQDER